MAVVLDHTEKSFRGVGYAVIGKSFGKSFVKFVDKVSKKSITKSVFDRVVGKSYELIAELETNVDVLRSSSYETAKATLPVILDSIKHIEDISTMVENAGIAELQTPLATVRKTLYKQEAILVRIIRLKETTPAPTEEYLKEGLKKISNKVILERL